MADILDEALSFYAADEIDAAQSLIGPGRTPVSGADVVVTGREEFGQAFGLLDRPAVYAGRLQERIGGQIQSWVESTPGAALALNLIDWSMTIAGGPARFVADRALGAVHDEAESAIAGQFTQAGYVDAVAKQGGGGAMTLIEAGMGGLALMRLSRRHVDRPDYQPTKPTGVRGDIAGNLMGTRTPSNVATYRSENEIAGTFADAGYRVYQNPRLTAEQRAEIGIPSRNPDYLIEGRPFDLFTPQVEEVSSIVRGIQEKTLPGLSRQADRVVIDLRNSSVTKARLENYVRHNPVEGLNELRIVTTDRYGQTVIQNVRR